MNPGILESQSVSSRSAEKPLPYIMILLVFVVGAYAYKLRTDGIFACPADGYPPRGYLAYCNTTGYGDYDHGAFWYGLEPESLHFATNAEVLFVGSSRMQFAFSTEATVDWFAARATDYFLLGFSHTVSAKFLTPLLEKMNPKAKVYVINLDRFFDDRESEPVAEIFHGSNVRRRYTQKGFWQMLHHPVCAKVPSVCGHTLAFYRNADNGSWTLKGSAEFKAAEVGDATPSKVQLWEHYANLAANFVSGLPVDRECVILTIAPSAATKTAEGAKIADALGLNLISPTLDGLRTYDGSHLDMPSAQRWSRAFFDIAGPRIRRCLETSPADRE
jgi:hypothetical protein